MEGSIKYFTKKKICERMIRRGYRAKDGTWQGFNLERFEKNYPKVYKEILKEYEE